jgi:DNA-binding NarL/FixJ family response regulator
MTGKELITILIADDHPMFRRGLRESIEEYPRFRIIAECADGNEALAQVRAHTPAVAVLDMQMPGMSGLEVAEALQRENHPTRVVFLTVHNDAAMFRRAQQLGASGYILKDAAVDEIAQGLDSAAAGETYCSPALTAPVSTLRPVDLTACDVIADDNAEIMELLRTLSPTERIVLSHVAEELSTDAIAERLFISPRTVDHHRSNIGRKLGLGRESYALVRFALKHKTEISALT